MEFKYNKLLIIDGSHALHRNICQPNLWEMRNSDGERTGGIYGTINTILKETSTFNYFPVVVFDGHLSSRRLNIYDNYKHHKDKQLLLEDVNVEPTKIDLLQQEQRQEYNRQREIIKSILICLGIPVIHLEDWEGDDIIYILTQLTKDSIIVSDDKDMIQMIFDDNNRRCRVRRGMRDEFWDIDTLKEKEINQGDFISCKAIVGDPSDNIPSACYGVGEKTALGLYKLYQALSNTNSEFPTDEKTLTEVCKKYDIAKRKAYLNFDLNQFYTNLLLMDLSLVKDDVTPEVINNIIDTIATQTAYSDYVLANELLNNQSIRTLNINTIINNLNRTRHLADIKNYEATKNVSDEIPKKIGGLF